MIKRIFLLICFLLPLVAFADEAPKVGLLVMATGKYNALGLKMIESAREHFLTSCQRTFFIFTDGEVPEAQDVVRVQQQRLGWPHDTLKRFHVYLANKDLFKDFDYLYAIDADMAFVKDVGEEVLGDLVATRHWGFLNNMGTYCGNKKSTAYVTRKDRKEYCCGAFYGGKREEIIKLFEVNVRNVDIDLKKGVIPKWHDEGHLNRYFIDHRPTVLLTPSYCFPDGWDLPFEPKLVALVNKSENLRK